MKLKCQPRERLVWSVTQIYAWGIHVYNYDQRPGLDFDFKFHLTIVQDNCRQFIDLNPHYFYTFEFFISNAKFD